MTKTQRNILKAPLVILITLPIGLLLFFLVGLGELAELTAVVLDEIVPKFDR